MSAWYILQCQGGYVGTRWQIFQNVLSRPSIAVVPSLEWTQLDNVSLYHGLSEASEGLLRARAVLGVDSRPAEVRFEGIGQHAKIIPIRVLTDTETQDMIRNNSGMTPRFEPVPRRDWTRPVSKRRHRSDTGLLF